MSFVVVPIESYKQDKNFLVARTEAVMTFARVGHDVTDFSDEDVTVELDNKRGFVKFTFKKHIDGEDVYVCHMRNLNHATKQKR